MLAHGVGAVMTVLLILALSTSANPADFQTGTEAFRRGDYVAALRE